MTLDVDQVGRLQAYQAAGSDVDEFIIEQKIPAADRDEARAIWADIEKTAKDNPDATMMVPSD